MWNIIIAIKHSNNKQAKAWQIAGEMCYNKRERKRSTSTGSIIPYTYSYTYMQPFNLIFYTYDWFL